MIFVAASARPASTVPDSLCGSRLGRIPGKLKKRMWIREGDLVVVEPWDFQNEKCNILHRYTKTEASYLSRRGVVPKSIDIYR